MAGHVAIRILILWAKVEIEIEDGMDKKYDEWDC